MYLLTFDTAFDYIRVGINLNFLRAKWSLLHLYNNHPSLIDAWIAYLTPIQNMQDNSSLQCNTLYDSFQLLVSVVTAITSIGPHVPQSKAQIVKKTHSCMRRTSCFRVWWEMANPTVNKQASRNGKNQHFISDFCQQIDESTVAHRTSEPPEVKRQLAHFPCH